MAKLQCFLLVAAVAFIFADVSRADYQGSYQGSAGMPMGYNSQYSNQQQQQGQRYRREADPGADYLGGGQQVPMGYNQYSNQQQQGQQRYRREAGDYQYQGGAQQGMGMGYIQQQQQRRYRREVASGQWDQKLQGKGAETFEPVKGPKSFKVNVADGIQGANQFRHEKWDKGAITGSYSQPIGDGKWQIVDYVADDKGFRIISTKEATEAELLQLQGQDATKDKADVNVDQNGDKSAWSVTADQLKNKSTATNQVVKEKKDKQ